MYVYHDELIRVFRNRAESRSDLFFCSQEEQKMTNFLFPLTYNPWYVYLSVYIYLMS